MFRDKRTFVSALPRLAPILVAASMALVLRLPHLGWGLPAVEEEAVPAKKALEMWGFATGRLDLDPRTAGWPALSFYAHLLLQHAQWLVGRLTGAYADRLDFWLAWQLDPTPVILWGRAAAVTLAAAVAGVGAMIGRRVAGAPGAWLTGLLLAVSPLLGVYARLVGPDVGVTIFAALAVLALLDLAADGRRRHYLLAAVWIGLGAAVKYTPALLAVSLYAVHLERRLAEGRSLRLAGLDDRRLWLAALVCLLAFTVATPYTLFDLAVLRRDVGLQTTHLTAGHFGHQGVGGFPFYLNVVLPAALGWPAFLAALAGLVLGRGRREVRVLIWCLLPLFVALGALNTRFDRYMLPLLPALAAGAAVLPATVALRWPRLGRRPALAAVTAGLLLVPALASVRLPALQGLPSTQAAATDWLTARATGPGVAIITERYGPHLVTDPALEFRDDPVFDRLDPARRARLGDRPFQQHQVVPMYTVQTSAADSYYDLRHWLAYDYLVTSGAVRNRYLAAPGRFPAQARFYADLERWAERMFTAAPGTDLRGPELRIHRVSDEARRAVIAARGLPTTTELLATREGSIAGDWLAFVASVAHHAALTERWQLAVPYAEAVVIQGGAEGRTDAMSRLAVARYHAGDLAGAEKLFTELATTPDRRVVALGYLGVLAERRGDPEAAAAFYRQVIALDPAGGAGDLARRRLAAMAGADGE